MIFASSWRDSSCSMNYTMSHGVLRWDLHYTRVISGGLEYTKNFSLIDTANHRRFNRWNLHFLQLNSPLYVTVSWESHLKSSDVMPEMVVWLFWFHMRASVVRWASAAIRISSFVQEMFSSTKFTSYQLSSYQPRLGSEMEKEKV